MAISFDHGLFRSIAAQVEKEYQMGGLSHGVYCDFAHDCVTRYVAAKLGEAGKVEHLPVEAVRPEHRGDGYFGGMPEHVERIIVEKTAQKPSSDLADGEKLALGHLAQAWNAFCSLPAQHEADKDEFMRAIHAAQSIIYTRLALRVLGIRFGEDA